MPGMSFRRRVGAVADVKELEYVIALHQTCMPNTRENATVGSLDIYRLLKSRHGLVDASHADIIKIVRELGGGDTVGAQELQEEAQTPSPRKQGKESSSPIKKIWNKQRNSPVEVSGTKFFDAVETPDEEPQTAEEDIKNVELEEYLDLVQILALLLIPIFAMASQEYRQGPKSREVLAEPTGHACILPFLRLKHKVETWWAGVTHKIYKSCQPDMELMAGDWRRIALRNLFDGNDGAGSLLDEPLPMNEDVVRELLLKYGEIERAQNPSLIREMVQVARSSSGMLDEEAWMNAVSSGLDDWNVNHTERVSTFFEDVFGTVDPRKVSREDLDGLSSESESSLEPDEEANGASGTFEEDEVRDENSTPSKPMFQREWFNIDMVLDAHASLWTVAGIWLFFVLFALVYGSLLLYLSTEDVCIPANTFGCEIVNSLISWSVAGLLLSACGLAVVMPMSFGNNPYGSSPFRITFSVIVTAAVTFTPYGVVTSYRKSLENGETPRYEVIADMIQSKLYMRFQEVTLTVGTFLLVVFVLLGLSSLFMVSGQGFRVLRDVFSTSNARAESRLKLSAMRKMKAVLRNAHELHPNTNLNRRRNNPVVGSISRSLKGDESTMRNYVLKGERFEPCGGFLWTWSRVFDGSLFTTEGIWINTRLIITQLAQLVVALVVSIFLVLSVEEIAQRAEDARKTLDPATPQWAVDLVPTRRMVNTSLYPASYTAIVVMALIIGVYIPSATSTVLKYRCQVTPSLGSPYFNLYREAVDSVYMNLSNGVWGMLGSGALFYALVGLLLFLFQWEFSQSTMIRLLGWGVGLTITIILKMLLTMACRSRAYRAFFRIRPRGARVASLALECWYIGLGGSVLLGRITQFLLAAAFFVGRIDVLFLSDNVEVFGYAFDYVPLNFVKDLLLHEAHRHPFLERLAQIYLMKLKCRSFCTRAGVAWRQLAVLALFPWLSRYRVFGETRLSQALLSFSTRQDEMRADQKGVVDIAVEDTVENIHQAVEGAGIIAVAGRDVTTKGIELLRGEVEA